MSELTIREEMEEEQKYLDKVISIIHEIIDEQKASRQIGYDNADKLAIEGWENQIGDIGDRAKHKEMVDSNADLTNNGPIKTLRRLEKTLKQPYFGGIRLNIDGDIEEHRIGRLSIMRDLDSYVIDWRSPMASLFYNSQLGETKFKTPNGIVECELLKRRQIKIKDDKIKRIINSYIHLSDDELQEVLSKSSSSKMKDIVTSIQEEQNEVIRNVTDKHIIVQGCAGSGKTSVALHRLAFLLYNDDKSTSENMLIFSPSDTFTDYISNVLPDLGEDNVLRTTFSNFVKTFVRGFDKIETYTEFVSKYYDGINTPEQNELNKFKYTDEYKKALDSFIQRKADSYSFQEDFWLTNFYVPKEVMNKIVETTKGYTLQDKIDAITDEIYRMIKTFPIKRSMIRTKVAREIVKPAFNPKALYNEFLCSPEFVEAYGKPGNKITKNLLEYPDLIGMLYLNFEMGGYPDNETISTIHHLVVDEAQDYGPLQMKMIAKMFRGASLTVLGDADQTINPYHKYESLEQMKEYIGQDSKYIELNKAYRSSKEIMDYVKEVLDNDKIIPVRVSNNNPVESKVVTKDNLFTELVSDIMRFREQGLNRICIITKSVNEARAIYEGLKDSIPDLTVLNEESKEGSDSMVAPSYMAKGLEFDAVINYNSLDNPYLEEDKYLYYVACTRAQHELVVYNEPKMKKKVINNG